MHTPRLSPTATLRSTIAAFIAAAAFTACTPKTTELSGGGFAPSDASKLSVAFAQARAQFPELSAQGLPYTMREAKGAATLELALQGSGVGFSRGLQLTERSKATIKVVLDKATYAQGYATVQVDSEREQTWPIVAYELRGKASERFEFSYLLTTPDGSLRYLVLMGSIYSESGKELQAYEGTLFVPSAGKGLENWARAYKFDFGFKYPARPEYQAGLDEAEGLFRDLQRDAAAIIALNERADRAADAAKQAAGGTTAQRGQDAAALEARATEAKAQAKDKAAETEAKALRYYEVRAKVDNAYAAFVLTNPYTWRDTAGQAEFYKRWQKVEFHHPKIDELVETLIPLLPDGKKLEEARAQAMALFAKNNNWDKNPEKAEAPPEPPPAKSEKR